MKKISAVLTGFAAACVLASGCAYAALSENDAADIALKHSGVAASDAVFTKKKLDSDDGIRQFEIEFRTNTAEYEYDVAADDGRILKFSYELIDKRPVQTPAPQSANPQPAKQGIISRDDAVQLILSRVPGAQRQHIVEFDLDTDDGIQKYEGEVIYQGREYDFEIDARTGEFLEWDAF